MKTPPITLEKAIELRQKYPNIEEYKMFCKSAKAYLFDNWLGLENKVKEEPTSVPPRPSNYKLLTIHWDLVDLEKAFEGYPEAKINDLIEKEELYLAPVFE